MRPSCPTHLMKRAEPQYKPASIPRDPESMAYVRVAPGGRYFMTEDGRPFLVIGHNDAMPWPHMHNLKGEQDTATTKAYIKTLVEHGVTVLRIMLEYCQDQRWFFERPVGKPVPEIVQYWDNLIGLCERHGMRLLVLFWDTFFLSRRWKHHPYSKPGTGFQNQQSMCTSPEGIEHEKRRIQFFIERWGNSPAIFGYDLFNEIHPHWGGTPEDQHRWVADMARFVKQQEMERWGKRHLLTVSVFGSRPEGGYVDLIFRHPELDFATTHVYQSDARDNPKDTVTGALIMQDAVKYAYSQMTDVRPYMDTESGPIFSYMHLKRKMTEEFEVEYYHNMSWAHLATGGAGSGMRWPFRSPHTLSPAMHDVEQGMAQVVSGCNLDWLRFSPQPIDHLLRVVERVDENNHEPESVIPFGCSDGEQALIWLLRDPGVTERSSHRLIELLLANLKPGEYVAEFWETYSGSKIGRQSVIASNDTQQDAHTRLSLPDFDRDIAITLNTPEHL